MQDLDLQLFAQEKTEPATPKRRQTAREKGQISRSQDLVSAAGLFAGIVAFKAGLGPISGFVMARAKAIWSASPPSEPTLGWAVAVLRDIFGVCLLASAPVAAAVFALAILASVSQTGFGFRLKLLAPSFSKIDPVKGFTRFFSLRTLADGLRSLLKISCIGICAWLTLKDVWSELPLLAIRQLPDSLGFLGNTMFRLALNCSGFLLILGGADYAYQRWELERSLKMTRKEVRDEIKDQEIKPEVKSAIRAKQRAFSRRRMMQDVPNADAVIVNPEHYAVAIKYDQETSPAPTVVAKGLDELALRIRKTAHDNGVHVVSNPPLARALYRAADVGEMIPEDLYKAVAEVLAYVYRLSGKTMLEEG